MMRFVLVCVWMVGLLLPLAGWGQRQSFEDLPRWRVEFGLGNGGYVVNAYPFSSQPSSKLHRDPQSWGGRLVLRYRVGASPMFLEAGWRHTTWIGEHDNMHRTGQWLGAGFFMRPVPKLRMNLNLGMGIVSNYAPFTPEHDNQVYEASSAFVQGGVGVEYVLHERWAIGLHWTGANDMSPLHTRPHWVRPGRTLEGRAIENLLCVLVGWRLR